MLSRKINPAAVLAAIAGAGFMAHGGRPDVIPEGGSREPQRRNSSRDSHRVADPERERRAAEKRARKAAKRLREQATTEGGR